MAACALILPACTESPEGATPNLPEVTADTTGADTAGDSIDVPPLDTGDEVQDGGGEVPKDTPEDVGPPPDCDTKPFGEYCACDEPADCFSGYCLQTRSGKECADFCVEDCPDGYSCQAVGAAGGGSDLNFVCVDRTTFLCMPCSDTADCAVPGFEGQDKCLDYGDEGSFCGLLCGSNGDCPAGYVCGRLGQCMSQTGTCDCAPLHQQLEAATDCRVSNEFGSCAGTRQCAAIGLTLCDATEPAAEICNGKDDDCSGVADDVGLIECTIDNEFGSCPGTTTCQGGLSVCVGAEPGAEVCNGKDDDCNGTVDDGYPNNDEDPLPDCVDPDDDNDGLVDEADNCQVVANLDQLDTDGDGLGDACDPDDDGDGSADTADCEPLVAFVYPFAPEVCDSVDNDCDGATDEKSCSDGNQCTDDECDPILGCENPFNSQPCEDGSPCTELDKCFAGTCLGTFVNCDDGNPCTNDECDPAGGCKTSFNALPCSDGNLCTQGDACSSGICLPGAPVDCDDGNECTLATCDKDTGCQAQPLSKPCNDSNPCTVDDGCIGGSCSGSLKDCSDGDSCTTDACDPDTPGGCVHSPTLAGPCDDGLPCTTGDHCLGGTCVPEVEACGCLKDSDCFDDGDLCNGTPFCDKSTDQWSCKVNPATIVTCALPGQFDETCATVTCQPETGQCTTASKNDGGSCSDGDGCTSGDTCDDGACVGTPAVCDDGNECTDDECDSEEGCISLIAVGFVACDDGNACTTQDKCAGGFCVGSTPVGCDDANPCTHDTCVPATGCVNTPNTIPCSDANACTIQDVCSGGQCVGQPLGCDDGDPWGARSRPTTGCVPETGRAWTGSATRIRAATT